MKNNLTRGGQSFSLQKKLIRIIRIGLILIFTCWINVLAFPGFSQYARLDTRINTTKLENALDIIEKQSEYYFIFNRQQVDITQSVSFNMDNKSIDEILDELFRNTDISYDIMGRQIILDHSEPDPENTEDKISIQQLTVTGIIKDAETGESLPGVSVIIVGTTTGAISDIDGKYSINISGSNVELQYSFIGYTTWQVPVEGRNVINVDLEPSVEALEEVVFVGYGRQTRETVTGAITSIGTAELVQSSSANISNALVGRMPGLLTKQTSGQPGYDQTELRIRGAGTFTGELAPLVLVDGVETENFNNIDPNEIDQLTILKDASATAVYGVRGANGVILITTRRGSSGAPDINYTFNSAATSFIDLRQNMDSYNHALTINEALRYDSFLSGAYNPAFSEEEIEKYRTGSDPIFYPNMNWHDELMRPFNLQTQHNFNIRGGTDRVRYFTSLGYFEQGGLFKNTDIVEDQFDAQIGYRRYNFRSNFDFDVTSRFKLAVNLSTQFDNRRGKSGQGGIESQILRINNASPHGAPGVIDGRIVTLDIPQAINPYFGMYNYGYTREYQNHLNGSLRATHDLDFITEGLSMQGLVSHQGYDRQVNTISRAVVGYRATPGENGEVIYVPQRDETPWSSSQSFGKRRRVYAEAGLNYAKRFGDHNVTGLLLYNQSKQFDPNLAYLIPSGYQGLVSRVTYDWQGRYLAEFNLGYNGTENFAEGKRFGFFPAYSLGWVISEETFFPQTDMINFLKIRASYGEVGNDRIGGERFLYRPSAYEYAGPGYYFGEVGSSYNFYRASREGKIGNPDLTWERAKKRDIGVEMTVWRNRLRVTVDVFDERRDNILANIGTIPEIVGANLPAYNFGKMKNQGFDGEIMFNDRISNFNYWVKGTYTYARNTILEMDEVPHQWPYQARTGHSLGQRFGLIVEGFYNTWDEVNDASGPTRANNHQLQPGDIKFRDVNGDGIISGFDYVPIGYPNFPGVSYGVAFGGSYRGFDFSVLFQGAANVSYTYAYPNIKVESEIRGIPVYLGQSWSQERYEQGLEINFPRLSSDYLNYQVHSQFRTIDASYVRLKNLELGYRFEAGIFDRMGIKSGRIFVNGDNLVTWSGLLQGIDPEQGSSDGNNETYPLTRTFNLGFNVNF